MQPVALRERIQLRVEPALTDLPVDLATDLAPAFDGTGAPEPLDGLNAAVERDPGHDLRVREVTPGPAYLPDPLVGFLPRVLEETEQAPLQRPCLLGDLQVANAGLVQSVEHLTVDVQLELFARRVADADGPRSLVTGEPVERDLRQPPLAGDPVHDLQGRGVACRCAQEPDPPRACFVEVSGVDKGQERER